MSWEQPQRMAEFGSAGPFAGLATDPSVLVRRQVLAVMVLAPSKARLIWVVSVSDRSKYKVWLAATTARCSPGAAPA